MDVMGTVTATMAVITEAVTVKAITVDPENG